MNYTLNMDSTPSEWIRDEKVEGLDLKLAFHRKHQRLQYELFTRDFYTFRLRQVNY